MDDLDRLLYVDSYPISKSKFIYVESNASTKRYGRLETSRKRKVTVDAPEHATKCFFNGAVRVAQSLYLRSTFGFGDRTRLRKRTTEETQTLAASGKQQHGHLTT